jgi:hypothetical protein
VKDIDFDELDRAVSSVLGQQTQATPPDEQVTDTGVNAATVAPMTDEAAQNSEKAAPSEVPVTTDETTDDDGKATDDKMSESTSSEEIPVSHPAPLAAKRRGKFMDVMHPSHDMTPNTPSPFTPKRKTLAPLTPTVTPQEVPETKPTADEPSVDVSASDTAQEITAATSEPATAVGVENEQPQKPNSLYVDPLELAPKSDTSNEGDTPESSQPESDVSAESSTDTSSPAPEPITTPFLNDAQVEKRPLGAFGDTDATPISVNTGDTAVSTTASDETLSQVETPGVPAAGVTNDTTQTAPTVPLPRELQPDVVQVETIQDDTQMPETAAIDTKTADVSEGHPLFDTSTYHEPTAAKQGKKTPGWVLWLIGLLACLAIGGGVGYFLFTAGL